MEVEVLFFAFFREAAGTKSMTFNLDGPTDVASLIDRVVDAGGKKLREALFDPSTGELFYYVKILKNGRDIQFLNGLSTPVEGGDKIAVFPPVGGG